MVFLKQFTGIFLVDGCRTVWDEDMNCGVQRNRLSFMGSQSVLRVCVNSLQPLLASL